MNAFPQPIPAPITTAAGTRILDAASSLFYERGINSTGVDLIALEAQVTKRTLYQRFDSKDALVAAYLRRRAHVWQTYLVEGLALNNTSEIETLYALTSAWVMQNPRGCAFVNAFVEISGSDHPALEVVRQEKAWMRELFDRIANNTATAMPLYLLYEGAQTVAMLQQTHKPLSVALSASLTLLQTSKV